MWLVCLVWTSPLLYLSHTSVEYHDNRRQNVVVCRTDAQEVWQKVYLSGNTVVFLVLPLVAITVLLGCIARALSKQRYENEKFDLSISASAQSQKRHVVCMLIAITVAFFFCVLPYHVMSVSLLYFTDNLLHKLNTNLLFYCLNVARLLLYVNSALNPILYNVFSSRFRDAFRMLCLCRKRTSSMVKSESQTFDRKELPPASKPQPIVRRRSSFADFFPDVFRSKR